MTKKDIPFDLLKLIEPIAQENLDLIKLENQSDTYYRFIEVDPASKNVFKIFTDGSKHFNNFDPSKYAFAAKPSNSSNVIVKVSAVGLQELGQRFTDWVKLIRDIHDTPSVHDDHFIRQYANFYYNEFKILDEDADISPFDPQQQDVLDLYLLSFVHTINNTEKELDQGTRIELLEDAQTIQAQLTTTTKNGVMRALSKLFGKLYKASRPLAKEVIAEAKKSLIKKLAEAGIDYGNKLLEFFATI